MADEKVAELTVAEGQALLEAVDSAFEQVLNGRFGGGIDVAVLGNADEENAQVLRMPGAGMQDRVRLLLRAPNALHGPTTGRGVMIGTVTLAAPPAKAVDEVSVLTEIMDHRDVNEAADATYIGTGVVFAGNPGGGNGELIVVRSSEAVSQADQHVTRHRRGWLPQQQRNNPSRPLGLGSNGHRRSPASGFLLPVCTDLLERIGTNVASAGIGGTEHPVGAISVVIETSGSTMP